jgi:hypothetical protein
MLGPFMCPLGPVLGPCDPAASDIVFQQERQIVRPALGLHGFLPEFVYAVGRLISVRSEVQIFPGPLEPLRPFAGGASSFPRAYRPDGAIRLPSIAHPEAHSW